MNAISYAVIMFINFAQLVNGMEGGAASGRTPEQVEAELAELNQPYAYLTFESNPSGFKQFIAYILKLKMISPKVINYLETLNTLRPTTIIEPIDAQGTLAIYPIIDTFTLIQAKPFYELFFNQYKTANIQQQKNIILHAYGQGKLDTAAFLLSLANPVVRRRWAKSTDRALLERIDKHQQLQTEQAQSILARGALHQELRKKFRAKEVPKLAALPGESPSIVHLKEWFGEEAQGKSVDQLIDMMIDQYYSAQAVERYTQYPTKRITDEHYAIFPQEKAVYKMMIKQIIQDEQAAAAVGYYCFYHAHSDQIKLVLDIQQAIEKWLELYEGDYVALRLKKAQFNNLDDFISYWERYFTTNPKTSGGYNSHIPKHYWEFENAPQITNLWDNYASNIQDYLLAGNAALFGNTNDIGKGSMYYFLRTSPTAGGGISFVLDMLKKYHFSLRYYEKFKQVFEQYMKPERGAFLIKICIPADLIDKFVYLAHPWGTPYRVPITDDYDQTLKRHMGIKKILNAYRTNPAVFNHLRTKYMDAQWPTEKGKKITPLNWLEVRIVMIPPYFEALDRIKFKTYSFVSEANKQAYHKAVDRLVNEMMIDWIKTGAYKEAIKTEDAGRFGKLIHLIETGQDAQALESARQAAQEKSAQEHQRKEEKLGVFREQHMND